MAAAARWIFSGGIALVVLASAAHAGPVTLGRQSRGVSSTLREVYALPGGSTTERSGRADATAPDLADFDRTVTAIISDVPAGQSLPDGGSVATDTGTLGTAEYQFILRFGADPTGATDIDYAAELGLTPAAATIPLPPAAATGLVGLAACGAGMAMSTRRTRR